MLTSPFLLVKFEFRRCEALAQRKLFVGRGSDSKGPSFPAAGAPLLITSRLAIFPMVFPNRNHSGSENTRLRPIDKLLEACTAKEDMKALLFWGKLGTDWEVG